MNYRYLLPLLSICLLVGCTGSLSQPTRGLSVGDALLDATFESASGWTTYTVDAGSVSITEGGYRIQARQPKLVFGLHSLQAADVIVEAEAYVLSDYDKGIYGVLCRVNSDGRGYYFLISANGNFSIRRMGNQRDDALVAWQGTSAIYTGKRLNRIRAVCVGDYLALYVNGTFVAEARDTLYHAGYIGVTAALPPRAAVGAVMDIAVDTVRVWEAE
jgi:hypothetical protein